MRPLYLTKEKLADEKFKITLLDKHQSQINPKEESTAFELIIDNGKLKQIGVIYNGEKKMTADFFHGPMGPVMRYNLLDPDLNLNDQFRLGMGRYMESGNHYLSRIVTDHLYPRVLHRYSDGAAADIYYNPYDFDHPLSVCLEDPGSASNRNPHFASFSLDKENGLVECRTDNRNLLKVQDMNAKDQTIDDKKQDTLKMEKMAIFAELDRLTPSQQRDVLAVTRAKLDLYKRNYGKE